MHELALDPPRHVAIIMDGNGRWARQQGRPRAEGHAKGADAVRRITRACRRRGVRALTLYAFSEENWLRPLSEVQALMRLLRQYLIDERAEILDNGIRLTMIGVPQRLPESVQEPLAALMRDSAGNDGMDLCLALSYGGQQELVDACRKLAERVRAGALEPAQIDEATITGELWSAHLPPIDLLIRTSGEQRLSNFMLWHAAYAELYYTETLWPDFDADELEQAFAAFARRQRRFGRTGDQVAPNDPNQRRHA